jgi:S1-C subfamily serine protease
MKAWRGVMGLLPGAWLLWLWSSAAVAAGLPDFSELVLRNGPAVVNISTEQRADTEHAALPKLPFELPEGPDTAPLNEFFRRFFGDQAEPPLPDASLGSGFIISADGYVLTNHHVVDGADSIIVRLSDRNELPATLVGSDARSDIALLKVESKNGALPTVRIGDPQRLKVGEWVLAIGSPASSVPRAAPCRRTPTCRSSRPTWPSIRVIPAARCSTWTARWSASTRRSTAAPAASWACRSRCRSTWPWRWWGNSRSTAA